MSYADGLRQSFDYKDFTIDRRECLIMLGDADSINSGHLITPAAFITTPVTRDAKCNVNIIKLDSTGRLIWGTLSYSPIFGQKTGIHKREPVAKRTKSP